MTVPDAQQQAQLWAIYFGLRGLKEPPQFLQEAQDKLRRHLESGQAPADLPVREHLRVVE